MKRLLEPRYFFVAPQRTVMFVFYLSLTAEPKQGIPPPQPCMMLEPGRRTFAFLCVLLFFSSNESHTTLLFGNCVDVDAGPGERKHEHAPESNVYGTLTKLPNIKEVIKLIYFRWLYDTGEILSIFFLFEMTWNFDEKANGMNNPPLSNKWGYFGGI